MNDTEQKPATVSFSRAKQTLAAQPPANPSTAVVPATAPGALTTPGNPAAGVVGEFDSTDLRRPPVLKFITGNSETATENPEWANRFCWDGALCLGSEIVIVPTKLVKTYREARPWPDKNPTPPASFKTKTEAEASGLDWLPVGIVEMLVELTPEQAAMAPAESWKTELAGKTYVPAVGFFQKTAYDVAKILLHDHDHHLKGRLANGQYKLYAKRIIGKTGPYLSPSLRSHGATSPELRDAIAAEFKI
jgi:hypothetical protein